MIHGRRLVASKRPANHGEAAAERSPPTKVETCR
jgi:hypothetical protein